MDQASVPPLSTPTLPLSTPRPARQWRSVLLIAYLIASFLPVYSFFALRGGLSAIPTTNLRALSYFLFPLCGLYAFTLLWLQVLVGSSMAPLTRLFPTIRKIHKRHGIYALVFACLHPLLLLVGIGFNNYITFSYISRLLLIFVLLGYVQLLILFTVVITALLMYSRLLRGKRWRYIHFLTYAAFVLAWIHSWVLGTDVQATPLRYLWLFAAATVLVSVGWRFKRSRSPFHT